MKLSLAIRLGAMLRPQAHKVFFDGRGSCALGAALEAAGVTASSEWRTGLMGLVVKRWPWTAAPTRHPCGCPELNLPIIQMIVHLNDLHHLNREQIAGFVEAVETCACCSGEEFGQGDWTAEAPPSAGWDRTEIG